jgi:hypothetical protein
VDCRHFETATALHQQLHQAGVKLRLEGGRRLCAACRALELIGQTVCESEVSLESACERVLAFTDKPKWRAGAFRHPHFAHGLTGATFEPMGPSVMQ